MIKMRIFTKIVQKCLKTVKMPQIEENAQKALKNRGVFL